MNTIILSISLPLLAGLLYFEKKESVRGILCTKPLLSSLFIVMAVTQAHGNMNYFYIILAGLVFCFIGDVCLILFFNEKIFEAGLAAFLIGHIIYSAAFFRKPDSMMILIAFAFLLIIAAAVIFLKLKPHLEGMIKPVIAYIVIISVMAFTAFSLRESGTQSVLAGNIVFAAALIFYLSDIFVARHRFVRKKFINRATGLPMYYAAQFMIAYSTGIVV
mgnify:FL=1